MENYTEDLEPMFRRLAVALQVDIRDEMFAYNRARLIDMAIKKLEYTQEMSAIILDAAKSLEKVVG